MTNETDVLPIPEFQPRENSVDSDDSNAGILGEPEPEPEPSER